MQIQELSSFAIERFDMAVLRWFSRVDEVQTERSCSTQFIIAIDASSGPLSTRRNFGQP
jgi:hypothetical protein